MLPKWDGTKQFTKLLERLGVTFIKCRKVKKYRVGWVVFACKEDMEAARTKIAGHKVKGNHLKAGVLALFANFLFIIIYSARLICHWLNIFHYKAHPLSVIVTTSYHIALTTLVGCDFQIFPGGGFPWQNEEAESYTAAPQPR